MYLWSKTWLPNYILSYLGDRMEMAHSVEARLPFLDHRLVQSVVRIPLKIKIRDLTEKYALREACRRDVTTTVYKRQKHPFAAPLSLVSKSSPLYQLAKDTFRSKSAHSSVFDMAKVDAALDFACEASMEVQRELDAALLFALSVCILQMRFCSYR
jgi:asparagine synthase (glutamine-hydrolysing)